MLNIRKVCGGMMDNLTSSGGDPPLIVFRDQYLTVHGYLSLTACLIGVPLNLTFILLLSKKELVTAVNRLLQAIGKY